MPENMIVGQLLFIKTDTEQLSILSELLGITQWFK